MATTLHRSHIFLKDIPGMFFTYIAVMLAGNALVFMSELFSGIMHRTATLNNVRGGSLSE